MKIKITNFALRHFDKKFGGTKILNYTAAQVEEAVNVMTKIVPIMDGYAPFCKLLCFKNTTDARVGSMKITLENYQYIRSGYSARTENELPVFSRWLELPLSAPKAEYLMFVLYSREQLFKEFDENKKDGDVFELAEDIDFGVVAILGQSESYEEPIKPETMIRNAGYNTEEYQKEAKVRVKKLLESAESCSDEDIKEILDLQGKMCGGSGVPINREKYKNSVAFWSEHATVK